MMSEVIYTHLNRSQESLRSGTEGGDLEMHEEEQRTIRYV